MGISNITGEDHHGNLSSANSVEDQEVEQNTQQHDHIHSHFLYGSTIDGSETDAHASSSLHQSQLKKKRNLPGTPDPKAEVIALSPTTLMATNRFVCEICNKGFQRDQNLQLHRRGHNLPWKLKQRTGTEVKKRVYVCPEPTCVHHNPARALGDLTGIKKHFSRKHGEKKWKCEKCSKKYAVQSDWKAHQKTCGTREYKCDCGTIFSRRDSFITHRAFCDALAEENNKLKQGLVSNIEPMISTPKLPQFGSSMSEFNPYDHKTPLKSFPQELSSSPFSAAVTNASGGLFMAGPRSHNSSSFSSLQPSSSSSSRFSCLHDSKNGCLQISGSSSSAAALVTSATALLQKAAQIGATASSVGAMSSPLMHSKSNSFDCARLGWVGVGDDQKNNSPYARPLEMPHSDQPEMVGINGAAGRIDMGIYGQMMMKEQENCSSSTSFIVHEKGQWPVSSFAGGGGESQMMTLDLLGEGGWRLRQLQEDQNQLQQQGRSEMGGMRHQTLPIMKHFELQNLHGDSTVDKSIFEF